MEIKKLEKAKSGNSYCVLCKRIIFKNTTRAVIDASYKEHPNKVYACPKCAIKMISNKISQLERILREAKGSFIDDIQINLKI